MLLALDRRNTSRVADQRRRIELVVANRQLQMHLSKRSCLHLDFAARLQRKHMAPTLPVIRCIGAPVAPRCASRGDYSTSYSGVHPQNR
jgi:hypothetical protein